MSMLDRLFSLGYWLEADPGALRPAGLAFYLALALLFALGLARSTAARCRGAAWASCAPDVVACMSGLGAVALRLASVPGCSARIFVGAPLMVSAGLLGLRAWLLPDWAILHKGWCALWAFRSSGYRPAGGASAALLAGHLLGLTVISRLLGWPAWPGLALLLALLAPQLVTCPFRRGYPPSILALNALLPAYLLAGLELGRRVALYEGWASATWPTFSLWPALVVLGGYAWVYQAFELWPAKKRGALAWAPPLLLVGTTLAWATWAYLTLYARGVTGSDPFCYVQMAVDVMRHGTLLHRFPLAPLAERLEINPLALMHVGYRRPLDALGWAPAVWPGGHSVLLGLAGRLAGEPAIYLATPLMGLASIAAVAWLAAALFDDLAPPLRWLAGGLAGLLVASSFEQLRWLLVHMADISAQLFSSLTVVMACAAATRGRRVYVVAAGLALAMAYWARHTQLAMALPALALLALAGRTRSRRERLLDGATYLGLALLGALPDLAYHQLISGSPLRPESQELALYSLRAVPATTALLLRGWLAAPELGWLAPFLAGGTLALYRRNRRACLVLGLWLVALWAVQAPYAALRLRDLLPALPALALLAAYGTARALAWLAGRWRAGAVLLALGLAALLWLRTADTAARPLQRSFNNFGYLWATQRQEFTALQGQTKPNAVIGSTLNSGPLELYARRESFRPSAWQPDELRRFLEALWEEGRPTYLLADGLAMDGVLGAVGAYARVTPVHTLRLIPCYTLDAGSELRDVTLYRLYRVGP